MLGRVRPSSSSLESLELERLPSKIIKDDSLSIYEATLAMLRQGSQRDLVSSSQQTMSMDDNCNFARNSPCDEATTTDTDCSSTSIASSFGDCHPMGTSIEQRNKTISVVYLFAKYKSAQRALSSPDEERVDSFPAFKVLDKI